jgi:hypothetical protein
MHVCCFIGGCIDCIGESRVAVLRSVDCWPRFCWKELTRFVARICPRGHSLFLTDFSDRAQLSPYFTPTSRAQPTINIRNRPSTLAKAKSTPDPTRRPGPERGHIHSSHHVVIEQRVSALIQPQNFRTRSKNKRKRRSYSLPRTARGNLEFQIIEREGSAPPKPPISLLLRGCSGV